MKKILTLILLMITSITFGQKKFSYDCNSKPLIVGAMELGVRDGIMEESVKIGLWQNSKPSGFTAFIGCGEVYEPNNNNNNTKNESGNKLPPLIKTVTTPYVELGYKLHITDYMFLHGYGGRNNLNYYAGGEILIEVSGSLLMGANFKKQNPFANTLPMTYGGALYFAF